MIATASYFGNATACENTEIAHGLRRRDPDLIELLIEKYQHRLLRYLVHLAGHRHLAEDLFQETWIRVLERGSQYNGRHEFSGWLFAIARHLFLDHQRRKNPSSLDTLSDADDTARFEVPPGGLPSALELTLQREQHEQISTALRRLPSQYREALALRFQEGMALEEIANLTGVPVGTVKSRLYRGLSALQPWLKGARL